MYMHFLRVLGALVKSEYYTTWLCSVVTADFKVVKSIYLAIIVVVNVLHFYIKHYVIFFYKFCCYTRDTIFQFLELFDAFQSDFFLCLCAETIILYLLLVAREKSLDAGHLYNLPLP